MKTGALGKLLRALAEDLRSCGKLDLTEAYVDGSDAGTRRGSLVGVTRRVKATKIMAVANRNSLSLPAGNARGQRNEQKLVVETLMARFVEPLPESLIGDKAQDSDPLDTELAEVGVETISPHHPRRRRKTQDGRKLRRYRHRWRIKQIFAWLLRQRCFVSRRELKAENFVSILQLACAQILWRRF